MNIVDAHNHYWRYDAQAYSWIGDEQAVLKQDFMPADLVPEMEKHGITATVAVQGRASEEENNFLLDLAAQAPFVKGVVGWIDFEAKDVEEQLQKWAAFPKFKGLRHFIQSEPDEAYMLGAAFNRGIFALKEWGLSYDILVGHTQLPAVIKFLAAHPGQPFVLDHIAKPPIKAGLLEPWKTHMQALAKYPQLSCKISGLVTEADWQQWQESDIKPYLDVVFEAFGPERLMFGSDWPVCLLAGAYGRILALVQDYIQQFTVAEQQMIMSQNAQRFYKL